MMSVAYVLSRNQSVVKALNARLIIVFMSAMILSGFISVLQYQTAFTLKRVVENIWYVFYYRIMYDAAFMSSLAFQDF